MIKIELESRNGHDYWLEVRRDGDFVRVAKKNSMPVYDTSKYSFSVEDGSLVFQSGSKSCSGAGKSRSVSPSDKIVEKVEEEILQ